MAVEDTNRQVSVEGGGMAQLHNYYVPDEFIQRHEKSAGIYLRDGQRAALASEDFVVALHQGLEDDVGEASNLIMYHCGFEWGVQDGNRFANRMRHEYGGGKKDIWQMHRNFVMECWWWPLTMEGWGSWNVDFSYEKQGMTFITIHNSAVARSMEQVGKPVCHMYAGVFAGFFSVYNRLEKSSIEVQCYSMGNDCCKFLLGDADRVNAAEFWVNEGANAEEIMERLL